MSWRGFKRGLDDLLHPPYLRDLTPEERAERAWRGNRNSEAWWFFEAADKPVLPAREHKQDEDLTG
jgi:hypothetical protein